MMELRNFTSFKTFGGIDNIEDGFRVVFDKKVYEIIEDYSDGYRSYLNDVVEVDEKVQNTFEEVKVMCVYIDDGYQEIVEVYDIKSGKEILTFGTENYNDYYPCCVLNWKPENMYMNQKED